jgi:ParB-like chromosome segregation protein Spo0J
MGKFKIAEVQLSDIKLVKKNAHFMQQDTFNALVNNIRRDGQLSSVPFCVKHSDGSYTVVSGNHRTQAAKMAGLTSIHVMYIDEEETTNDWLLATQLSHNSIVGQDDAEILKQLLDEITDVALKEYAHISNEVLESVKDINYTVEQASRIYVGLEKLLTKPLYG